MNKPFLVSVCYCAASLYKLTFRPSTFHPISLPRDNLDVAFIVAFRTVNAVDRRAAAVARSAVNKFDA